jgi:hypothetical protein
MSVLNEIAQLCEQKTLETLRIPVLAKVPSSKYKELIEQMKGIMRLPPMEMVHGENGWRMETAQEYSERINKPPTYVTLTLTTGTLRIVPHSGINIEVEFEKEN